MCATKSSFAAMKKRLGGISTSGGASAERPFFDVSVELTVPRVTMNPTLDDIQAAINATAKKVIIRLALLHYLCMKLPACTVSAVLLLAVQHATLVVPTSTFIQQHAVISNYWLRLMPAAATGCGCIPAA